MRAKIILNAIVLSILLLSCKQNGDLEAKIQSHILNKMYDSALVLTQTNKANQDPCEYAKRLFWISQNINNADSLVLSTRPLIENCGVPNDSLYPAYSEANFGISRKYTDIDTAKEKAALEKALNEARKCVNENPNNIRCYKIGHKAMHNLFNSQEELRWIIPAYKKWPNDPEISAFYGVALMMSNDYVSAISVLEKCFQCIDTGNASRFECAAGLRFRGLMFDDMGKPDSALNNLRAAWMANPSDYQSPTAMGRIWNAKHKRDSACKYFREGLKLGDITEQEWIKEKCNH